MLHSENARKRCNKPIKPGLLRLLRGVMVISLTPRNNLTKMIKLNTRDDAQKPTKKGRKKAVKPSTSKDGQQVAKSGKTQSERISRRWLMTTWPEHLSSSIAQPIAIDSAACVYDIDIDALTAFLGKIPHFRSFTGSIEYGEETKHVHLQGYLELFSPVRKTALIKSIGTKHYYEPTNGSQQDCLDYVLHTGTHSDKTGLVYALPTIGKLAYAHNQDNHETTLYNTALSMVLEGQSMIEVVRSCGIGISKVYFMLKDISDRIQKEGELKEERNIDVKNQIISQALKSQKENIYYLRQDAI